MSNRAESFLEGLIGDGVAPSLTPPMHEREGDVHGPRYLYRPIDLTELGLPDHSVGELLTGAYHLGFNGLNITHPCKQLVLEHLDQVTPDARCLQTGGAAGTLAANTILTSSSGLGPWISPTGWPRNSASSLSLRPGARSGRPSRPSATPWPRSPTPRPNCRRRAANSPRACRSSPRPCGGTWIFTGHCCSAKPSRRTCSPTPGWRSCSIRPTISARPPKSPGTSSPPTRSTASASPTQTPAPTPHHRPPS